MDEYIQNNQEQIKKIPLGIKMISIVCYIGAFYLLIMGILTIVGAGFVSSLIPSLGTWGQGVITFLGVIIISLGTLFFFVARGLWKGKSWARIIAIIITLIGLISMLYSLLQGFGFGQIIEIVINGIIGYYLIFDKEVKEAFKKS